MPIELYDGENLISTLHSVISASFSEKLSGELSLSVSTLSSRSEQMANGQMLKLNGQYYSIVRIARKLSGGMPITTASCEHVSYLLNDEKYNLVTFVFEGTPADGMAKLLEGTPFSLGINEATDTVAVAFTEGTLNRRNAVMRFIDACGCEIEYDGFNINLRKHRGSSEPKVLMDGKNVTDLSVTIDAREDTQSYEISFYKMADLQVGDEVSITFTPMAIDVRTRIVGIEYNPFYKYTIRIEVGDYVPNLMASTSTQLANIKQEFRAADGEMQSSIQTLDGNMSILTQTVSTYDVRIQNAEGAVAEMELTVGGFDSRITQAETLVQSYGSEISQLANKIALVVTSKDGTDTVNSAEIIAAINEDGSSVTINANKVDISSVADDVTADVITGLTLSASNGEYSSTIKLKYGSLELDSVSIYMDGMVTFTDLETDGYTTINGSNITTGTISADRIDTESLACTAVYAKDYPNGHYFALDGDWGDFGIFSPNAESTNDPRDSSCVFGAFQSDIKAINFYCFGYNFMGFNATTSNTLFAKGKWDFTSAYFTGVLDFSTATNIIYPDTTSVVAVFGA
ncbi:MAG: phage tail protein [Clostridia bacterium]|nr:phage tail protein [Clostridia bacterium]